MFKQKYYYKVVTNIEHQLRSYIDSYNSRSIVYIPNRWVKPRNNKYIKGGPLAVFDTLENARNFIEYFNSASFRNIEIWRCEIKKSKLKTLFYKYNKHSKIKCSFSPKGTILADKVKLINKID